MTRPNKNWEKKLIEAGHQNIIGVDEVGRGAWAGPIVAAALVFDVKIRNKYQVNDSKLLTAKARDKIYNWLTKKFQFGVGVVSQVLIDEIGLAAANELAMRQAVLACHCQTGYLLIDAFKLKKIDWPQQSIIKGDQKVWTIAAASIVAKVTRDRIMKFYDKDFSCYQFADNKGYGTQAHRLALKEFGYCQLHRKSYLPIKKLMANTQS